MRDSTIKSNQLKPVQHQPTAARRRRWLTASLMMTTISSASVVMAENNRPLLPLTQSVDVKVNPFCLPQNEGFNAEIELASNGPKSPVRLKKIGAVIGLHSIENGEARRGVSSKMVIEQAPAGSIQANPLAASAKPQPQATQVGATEEILPDPHGQSESTANQLSSKMVLKPLTIQPVAKPTEKKKMVITLEPGVYEPPMQDHFYPSGQHPADPSHLGEQPEITTGDETEIAAQMHSQPQDAHAEETGAEASEPILFSLSDQPPAEEVAVAQQPEPPALDEIPQEIDEAEAMANALPVEAMIEPKQNQFCQPADQLLEIHVDEQQQLRSKRYRPPVDIHPVPLAIQGSAAEPMLQMEPVVDMGAKLATTPEERILAKTKVIPLYLNHAQVRSLTLGAELHKVEIANKEVCRAFAAGPNQLKLIGTGSGVTRLVVWAEPLDSQSPPRVRAFDVHVKEVIQEKGDSLKSKVTMLNESIRNAFPHAEVVVRQRSGKITVSGRCGEDAEARKIVRMVRKTCLVPVEDQLQIR